MLFRHRTAISQRVTPATGTLRVGDGGRWLSASATNALRYFSTIIACLQCVNLANEASCAAFLLAHLCGWGTAQFRCLRRCWMNSASDVFKLELHVQTVNYFLHVYTGMCTLPPEQPHIKNLCKNETMVWWNVLRGFVILQCCWGEDCLCIYLPVPRPERTQNIPVVNLSRFCFLWGFSVISEASKCRQMLLITQGTWQQLLFPHKK